MTNEEAIKILNGKMDGSVDTSYEWAETVRMAIKALEQEQPEQWWIPCSERLPEETERYIITAYDGVSRRTTTAMFQKRLREWCLSGRMAYWRVVAWMPLPKPYMEEEE